MPIRDRLTRAVKVVSRFVVRRQNALITAGICCFIVSASVFTYFYVRFSSEIDARLSGQIFDRASVVFSAPTPITVGEAVTPDEVAARLRRALYAEGSGSRVGIYTLEGDGIKIRPGSQSYFAGEPVKEGAATVGFKGGRVAYINTGEDQGAVDRYFLEPEPITTLFDQSRTKRRLVRYQDLPPVLINAVLAAEDRRFNSHHGVNFYRIFDAALKDIRSDERLQGGSTLTMQLARNFFLTPERTVRRKAAEMFLAMVLEQRLSKEQIFELYANEVYLGQRGSFSIDGFSAAAAAYFNKDVKNLNLSEAALLAGLIRGPNLYSPYRHPQAALRVRNYVLQEMANDGFASEADVAEATEQPLHIAPQNIDATQAPYFVDMVKDQLLAQFSEHDLISQSYRVYTTLDPDLQAAASGAVRSGMEEVDSALSRRHTKDATPRDPNQPQVALVVLDPHTGEVRALVGGRDYAVSQLNHALASRQPGSSFKPFVYAAALSSAVDGSQPQVTPATILTDEPTTFEYDDKVYEPRNYKEEYHGPVTLREALAYSLNCATVSLAQLIGYGKVQQLAINAGINDNLEATPALALGSYDATPMEIASAYTIFSNAGEYAGPRMISAVRDEFGGRNLLEPKETRRQVLDPRVAYQMISLMGSVLDHGTGAGVRSRGFTKPAVGKTGTSHDGWFAGFTTNLLAVVWVGYDDNRDIGLSGAASALPVWTDFMKTATSLPDYKDVQDFTEPSGLVTASIQLPTLNGDPAPLAASPTEIFIEGTEPHGTVAVLNAGKSFFSRLLHLGEPAAPSGKPAAQPPAAPPLARSNPVPAERADSEPPASQVQTGGEKKKPNVVRRFFSIFKHHE
ncbi:MAG TPA: PBP1A family penicillin-binding protein [Terriglobia bacterium]|nr:PBP1A family penicillin-binding protein [Terriglobia bacterium]